MELKVECLYVLRCRADIRSPWRDVVQSGDAMQLLRLKHAMEKASEDEAAQRTLDLETVSLEIDTADLLLDDPNHPNRPHG